MRLSGSSLTTCSLRRGLTKIARSERNTARVGEFLSVARKLAGEDTEQLVENRLGDNKLILLLDNAPQCRFAASGWKDQGRDENVRVEDDLHSSK